MQSEAKRRNRFRDLPKTNWLLSETDRLGELVVRRVGEKWKVKGIPELFHTKYAALWAARVKYGYEPDESH